MIAWWKALAASSRGTEHGEDLTLPAASASGTLVRATDNLYASRSCPMGRA